MATVSHRPFCLWITGLSGAGKSAVATALRAQLAADGTPHYVLDGDAVREGLNSNLGFSREDRAESVRRVGEIARLMVDAGLVVVVAMISPFRDDRQKVRERFAPGQFVELFLDTPLDVCETRDPKGLYKRARSGELAEFTGISSAYEPPAAAEIHIRFDGKPTEDVADVITTTLTVKYRLLRRDSAA